jgi:cytochrome c oxidase cbb3-type subunit 3/ubiquinol-cytochrome c reductase cytochrome c subunit
LRSRRELKKPPAILTPCKAAVLLAVLASAGCGRRAPAAVQRGRDVYAQLCATCHGASGEGYVADNAPSLRNPNFLASASDAYLNAAITRGRPGTAMGAYGRALGGPLPPEDVNAVVAYLLAGGPRRLQLPSDRVAGDATRGQPLYQNLCSRCHGTRTQRASAVHLANPILLQTASDAFLRFAVVEGRLPTAMVAWKGQLSLLQIDDVVAYVRSLEEPPGIPAVPPPPAAPGPPAAPRTGPIVLNPRGRAPAFTLKEDRFVSIDQVKKALDEKRRVVITDARTPSDWLNLHIKGAISTPYYDARSLDDIPNDGTWVLAYCACPHHVSGEVVDALRKRGYQHAAVIDEGIFAWQQKGYPVVMAPGMRPPPTPPPPK